MKEKCIKCGHILTKNKSKLCGSKECKRVRGNEYVARYRNKMKILKKMSPVSCKGCGIPFYPKNGEMRNFHSKECRKEFLSKQMKKRIKQIRESVLFICGNPECKKPFIRSHGLKKYCSDECFRRSIKLKVPRKIGSRGVCEICKEQYIVTQGSQRYCPRCRSSVKYKVEKEYRQKQCMCGCGRIIQPRFHRRKFYNSECCKRYNNTLKYRKEREAINYIKLLSLAA